MLLKESSKTRIHVHTIVTHLIFYTVLNTIRHTIKSDLEIYRR